MYICDNCGAEILESDVVVRKRAENLDGENGIENYTERFCPVCDSGDIRPMETADFKYWEEL